MINKSIWLYWCDKNGQIFFSNDIYFFFLFYFFTTPKNMSDSPLKSCLRKKGAESRGLNVVFHEKMQIISAKNEKIETDLPPPNKKKRALPKDSLDGSSAKKEEKIDYKIDIDKYLGKSIYDSSSEDEEEGKTNGENGGDKNKKSKSKNSTTSDTSGDKKKKKGVSLKSFKGGKKKKKERGVQLYHNPKDLDSKSKNYSLADDTLLMDGVFSIKLPGKEMITCKFSIFGNGIIDCFKDNEELNDSDYLLSLKPLFRSNITKSSEISEDMSENSTSTWTCIECFSSPKSSEYDSNSSPKSLSERFTVVFLFPNGASDKTKFMIAIKYYFVTPPPGEEFKSKGIKKYTSAKNLSKVFKKEKQVPFPGIKFHDSDKKNASNSTVAKSNSPSSFPGIEVHTDDDFEKIKGRSPSDEDKKEEISDEIEKDDDDNDKKDIDIDEKDKKKSTSKKKSKRNVGKNDAEGNEKKVKSPKEKKEKVKSPRERKKKNRDKSPEEK